MAITTQHQFIDHYPVNVDDERLILGTIHPHSVDKFLLPFFYGNEGYLWKHLSNAFPCRNFENVREIENTLKESNVWISDMIRQCDRNHAGVTKDEDLFNININKRQIENGLINSRIHTIYFTSAFACNNAANLFVKVFGINYKETYDEMTREFIIPSNHFGRKIRGVVIYSPTDGANRGIAKGKLYKKWLTEKWNEIGSPMNAFKVVHYQEKMNFFDS